MTRAGWVVLAVCTLAALALSAIAPVWVVALLIPVAGLLVAWGDRRRTAVLERGLQQSAARAERTRERAEHEAKEASGAAASCRAALDAVAVPVIATDGAGRVAIVNAAACGLLGDREALVGLPLEEVITGSAVLELWARAERGEAATRHARLMLTDEARIYEVSAVPVAERDEAAVRVVLTIRDVHELSQTSRLRSDFAANASHELRTPIAALRAAVETLGGPGADDAAMHARLVGMLETNTARLEEIVDDLLDLSRLESEDRPLRLEMVDLVELSASLAGMFEGVCRDRRLTLAFDLSRPGRVRTDRTLLLLILRNLIDNATKFAFEGTTVRVRSEATAGDGVRIAVADKGIGIPLKHQERIFERFYQVDESRARIGARRGSGLGLAIVRHALRRLGGEIRVESVWQEGTTMTVEIPGR